MIPCCLCNHCISNFILRRLAPKRGAKQIYVVVRESLHNTVTLNVTLYTGTDINPFDANDRKYAFVVT